MLVLTSVLKMLTVLIDEVPNKTTNLILCPDKPVLGGWLDVKHGPTVKLGRVHLANLILAGAGFAAVDCRKDASAGMKIPTVKLATVSQLKDTLTDLWRCAVNLVKKQSNRLLTSSLEPVWSVPDSAVAVDAWETHEVALGHL